MAKKNFSIKQDSTKTIQPDKPAPLSSLSLLAKQENPEPEDIYQISLNLNNSIIKLFEELYGPKWKYRLIKEVENHTGVELRYSQLSQLIKGRGFHQQNLVALLLVLAQHYDGISLEISKAKEITIKH